MNYEQFVCAMLECTKNKLSENEWVERQEILKNNGIVSVGLTIRRKEERIAPLIYLEEFYQRYLSGASLDGLAETLIRTSKNAPSAPVWDYTSIFDFQKIRHRIVYKLVNAEKNEKLLKEVPHLPVLDFAVVFYLLISMEGSESCSVLIRNEHMNLWKSPLSILYQYAQGNTPRLCPYLFRPLNAFVDMPEETIPECPMLVLSNEMGINGAAAILYPGMPGKIYETIGKNYYLLPATIHEFLIIPEDEGIRPENLLAMLREVNETQVRKEEVLSDHLYYFDGNIITKM